MTSGTVYRHLLWRALCCLGLTLVLAACKEAPPAEEGPPPVPPAPAPAEVNPAPDPVEAAASLAPAPTLIDKYTVESVNPWQRINLEGASRFALVGDPGGYTAARLELEAGQKPTPAEVRVEGLLNHLRWRAPNHGKALGVAADTLASPFEGEHAFVRVTVAAMDARPHTERAPTHFAALILLSDDAAARGFTQRALRDLVDRWQRGSLEERGDTLAIVDAEGHVTPQLRMRERDAVFAQLHRLTSEDAPDDPLAAALSGDHAGRLLVFTDLAALPDDWTARLAPHADHTTVLALGRGEVEGLEATPIATLDDVRDALDRVLGVDPIEDIAVHDASAAVHWNPEHVKSARLLGFENHADTEPEVSPHALRRGQSVTAVFEIQQVEDPQGSPGRVDVTYAMTPGGATQTLSTPIAEPLPVVAPKGGDDGDDLRFAVGVAAFAEILRDSTHARRWPMEALSPILTAAAKEDAQRQAFLELFALALPLYPPPEDSLVASDAPKRPRRALPTTRINKDDAAKIKRVLEGKRGDVVNCVKRIQMKHGHLTGTVSYDIVVERGGEVRSARPVKNDIGHGVERCITGKIKRWRFPRLSETVKFRRPWTF